MSQHGESTIQYWSWWCKVGRNTVWYTVPDPTTIVRRIFCAYPLACLSVCVVIVPALQRHKKSSSSSRVIPGSAQYLYINRKYGQVFRFTKLLPRHWAKKTGKRLSRRGWKSSGTLNVENYVPMVQLQHLYGSTVQFSMHGLLSFVMLFLTVHECNKE